MTGDFITGVYKLAAHIKKAPTITEVSWLHYKNYFHIYKWVNEF